MSRPGSLRLDPGCRERLDAWRTAGGEEEVCGLLVGQRRGATLEVQRVELVANLAEDRRSTFLLDPGAQVASEDGARRSGLEVLGAWHTHPSGSPHPSTADRDGAWTSRVTLIGGGDGAWAAWWPERDPRARVELVELRLDAGA